jgi:hypothetical protein
MGDGNDDQGDEQPRPVARLTRRCDERSNGWVRAVSGLMGAKHRCSIFTMARRFAGRTLQFDSRTAGLELPGHDACRESGLMFDCRTSSLVDGSTLTFDKDGPILGHVRQECHG